MTLRISTFADAVLADVASRFPLDQARYTSRGFSRGGDGVRYACARGDKIAGLYDHVGDHFKAGQHLRQPAGQVRHVHGLNDLVD